MYPAIADKYHVIRRNKYKRKKRVYALDFKCITEGYYEFFGKNTKKSEGSWI